jgi:hypothetical protein
MARHTARRRSRLVAGMVPAPPPFPFACAAAQRHRTVYAQNGLRTERFTHKNGLHTRTVYTHCVQQLYQPPPRALPGTPPPRRLRRTGSLRPPAGRVGYHFSPRLFFQSKHGSIDNGRYGPCKVEVTNLTPGSEQPYQRNPVMSTAPNVHAALREGGLSSELGKLLERWGWYALTPPDP